MGQGKFTLIRKEASFVSEVLKFIPLKVTFYTREGGFHPSISGFCKI